jgi:hypothetical protein
MPGSRGRPAPRRSALDRRRTFRALQDRARYSIAARLELTARYARAAALFDAGRAAEARALLGGGEPVLGVAPILDPGDAVRAFPRA